MNSEMEKLVSASGADEHYRIDLEYEPLSKGSAKRLLW
jgi:hypothetical protein